MSKFVDGKLEGITFRAAHPGRIGEPLQAPLAIVSHTTDTLPSAWKAMLDRVCSEPGKGDGAHFWIGRDESEGVAQTVPITHNAEHAGGPRAGKFTCGDGRVWAPNHVAIGIETNCAGGLSFVGGAWHQLENGKAAGEAIPASDVIPDPARPGRGWHALTPYQYEQWGILIDAIMPMLAPEPAGFRAVSTWEAAPSWAAPAGRVFGHVTLDARDRADPWPPTMAWLRERSATKLSA